jgi:hypothetical protein
MRNNALFRLLTVLLIALGLGLFLGGSFSPAMEVIASGSTSSINGVEIFLRLFSNTFYLLFLPEEPKEAEKLPSDLFLPLGREPRYNQ